MSSLSVRAWWQRFTERVGTAHNDYVALVEQIVDALDEAITAAERLAEYGQADATKPVPPEAVFGPIRDAHLADALAWAAAALRHGAALARKVARRLDTLEPAVRRGKVWPVM